MPALSQQLWEIETAETFLASAPPPASATSHGKGTDVEADLPLLWAVTKLHLLNLCRPAVIAELGTRQGITTRTLASAARAAAKVNPELTTTLYAIDPEDCRSFLHGVPCIFIQDFAENVTLPEPVDILFVDTDPHSYDQTLMWCETWVERLPVGALAAFHDVFPARPEVRVRDAVETWLQRPQQADRWLWKIFRESYPGTPLAHGPYGLGLLWRIR